MPHRKTAELGNRPVLARKAGFEPLEARYLGSPIDEIALIGSPESTNRLVQLHLARRCGFGERGGPPT
jgi:hypothetical protein